MVLLCFFFWITAKTSTSSLPFSLSLSGCLTLSISSSLSLCYLSVSSALPAVTAYLCEPMIYHSLIRDDYGAFHTALICCWARFSLHSCQLSLRQPANRPVSVSQLQLRHRGLSMHQWRAAWACVLLVWVLVVMWGFDNAFCKCLAPYSYNISPAEDRKVWSSFKKSHSYCLTNWSQSFSNLSMGVTNQLMWKAYPKWFWWIFELLICIFVLDICVFLAKNKAQRKLCHKLSFIRPDILKLTY